MMQAGDLPLPFVQAADDEDGPSAGWWVDLGANDNAGYRSGNGQCDGRRLRSIRDMATIRPNDLDGVSSNAVFVGYRKPRLNAVPLLQRPRQHGTEHQYS